MHPSLTIEPFAQMWARYAVGLAGTHGWKLWALGWFGLFLACLVGPTFARRPSRAARPWVLVLAALAPIPLALGWAWQLRWLPGDAFTSFRYADNFAHGRGLVWNVGERIDGYASFLWTVLLGGAIRLGLPPAATSVVLGMVSYAAILIVTWHLARHHAPSRSRVTLSIAALLLAANYLYAQYGASGLETMLTTLLALLALERAIARSPMAAGVAGILATLARPDLAILYVALGVALLLGRRRWRNLARYAVPFFVLFVPYWLWRWRYYGDFFPNAYYARSEGEAYGSQGTIYLGASILGGSFWAILPLGLIGAIMRRRQVIGRYALVATPLFLVHIARIGGDFMLGRLLLPLLPVLFVLSEVALRDLFVARRWGYVLPALAFLALAALPIGIVNAGERMWQVADERTFCEVRSLSPLTVESPSAVMAKRLGALLGKLVPQPLLVVESAGVVGYFSTLPTIDAFGLTDRAIAHEPLAARGRPGYEKHATSSYVLSRGAALSDVPVYPDPYDLATRVGVGGFPLHLVTYDPRVVGSLRGRSGITVGDVGAQIDAYVPPQDASRAECDLWFYEQFYFAANDDPPRRAPFYEKLRSAGILDDASAAFALDEKHAGWHEASRIDLSHVAKSDWLQAGNAFSSWPTSVGRAAQGTIVFGHRGPFLDTYDDERGDDATGVLQSPPFEIVGDVMELHVGGGQDPRGLRVALVIDGHRVHTATGCATELMGRRLWGTSAYKGARAYLEVADEVKGAWAHVLVDGPVQWARDE